MKKFKGGEYVMHSSGEGTTILRIKTGWTDMMYSVEIIVDTFESKLDPGRHDCNTIDKAYNVMADADVRLLRLLYEI